MDEYEYTTLSASKFWLEEGWYTPEDLQKIIDLKAIQEKHLRESMKPMHKGKNNG
jgi:hypothetical protein